MRKGFGTFVLAAAIVGLAVAPAAGASLSTRISEIIHSPKQRKTHFAVKVVDARTGQAIYAYNPAEPMIPASNMKVVTAAAALHYLGNEYKFTTVVGLLDDSLVVVGGGDPLLGDEKTDAKYGRKPGWIFDDVIAALRERGVTSVRNLYVDASFFDDVSVCPNWPVDQRNQWYEAEIAGLSYNNNCLKIHVQNSGGRTTVSVEPRTDYVKIVNQVKGVSRGASAVGSYRTTEPNRIVVWGNCRKDASFDLAVERPQAMFGFMLFEHFRDAGIPVRDNLAERYVRQETGIQVLRTYTTSIADVLARCNKDSLGMAAECLLKTISAENTAGRINGEWAHGRQLVARHLTSLGIPEGEFKLDDGSGLSRENRLSPNALTTVLLSLYNSSDWAVFEQSLAVGGTDGTIDKYFSEPKYQGKILGKTGYIEGVRSFSGICKTGQGHYIFSVLTQGGDGQTRAAINDIAKAVFDLAG